MRTLTLILGLTVVLGVFLPEKAQAGSHAGFVNVGVQVGRIGVGVHVGKRPRYGHHGRGFYGHRYGAGNWHRRYRHVRIGCNGCFTKAQRCGIGRCGVKKHFRQPCGVRKFKCFKRGFGRRGRCF